MAEVCDATAFDSSTLADNKIKRDNFKVIASFIIFCRCDSCYL